MTVRERFVSLLEFYSMQQTEFADKSGYGLSALKMFLNGRTKHPRLDFCLAVKKVFPNLSLDWLLLGEEPQWRDAMEKSNYDQNKLSKAEEEQLKYEEQKLDQELRQLRLNNRLMVQTIRRVTEELDQNNPELVKKIKLWELLEDLEKI